MRGSSIWTFSFRITWNQVGRQIPVLAEVKPECEEAVGVLVGRVDDPSTVGTACFFLSSPRFFWRSSYTAVHRAPPQWPTQIVAELGVACFFQQLLVGVDSRDRAGSATAIRRRDSGHF
uniref:(northern house mosquito) hypothetical protein n=1 Tax=Culex pipiens TaxID=7175 RepID=A0A8D8AYR1_CULPI